jgi:hypothetical protein|tara:strand:- start:3156 stop:3371 length:216 start_codon:yes stop_codon:yes gene_type:complete
MLKAPRRVSANYIIKHVPSVHLVSTLAVPTTVPTVILAATNLASLGKQLVHRGFPMHVLDYPTTLRLSFIF